MKKDTFKKSIFILLFGGLMTKVFGFIIRILSTRTLGPEGISYLTIVIPTYSLFITLSSLALPISISKMVSENKMRSKRIFFSTCFFILFFLSILIFLIFLTAPFIANNLLRQPKVYPLILAMALTLPFISITSFLKGYFLGKLKVHPNVISNFFEQITRILFILFLLPKIISYGLLYGVVSYILLNGLTEFISILVFSSFLPHKIALTKEDIKPNKNIIKEMLQTSLPSMSSRVFGNIGFFLEPILLTNLLLFSGYSSSYILKEYAAYNAYAIGLLTLPSFFVAAICQILIPEVSKYRSQNNIVMLKKRIREALSYSCIIGLFSSIFLFFSRDFLLNLLYKTTLGSDYIFILAPFFVLFYLEAPLSSILEASGFAKESFFITFWGVILKLVILSLLSLCHIGLYSLVFSEIINIIFVVVLSFKALKKVIPSHL